MLGRAGPYAGGVMHCLSSSGPDYKTDIQTPGRQHTVADFYPEL